MSQHTPYSAFIQQMPELNNEFTDDVFLQDYLNTYFPANALKEITPDLTQFGRRTATEFVKWAREA
jgi:hypothetical protein